MRNDQDKNHTWQIDRDATYVHLPLEIFDEAAVKETKRPTLHGRVWSEVAPLMLQQKESGVGVKICCACVACRSCYSQTRRDKNTRLMQERGKARASTLPLRSLRT
jgi:hypothetical protein